MITLLPAVGCSGNLGEARELEARGDLMGAVAIYEMMLADDPDDLDALAGIATDLLMLQRYDEALEFQERVVALDPEDVQTRLELGFNYLNHQEEPDEAVRVLSEAAALEPSGKHMGFLAQAQVLSGDVTGGEATLREALDKEPQYGRTYELLIGLLQADGRESEVVAVQDLAAHRGVDLEGTP